MGKVKVKMKLRRQRKEDENNTIPAGQLPMSKLISVQKYRSEADWKGKHSCWGKYFVLY